LLFAGSSETVFSGGIALLCGCAVAIFVQPPVLSYKSWRYQRANRN
jgi:membrane protein YdbS with pleckstrin-like domain